MNANEVSQTRWGKARFGGSSAALIGVSLGIGIFVSASLGWGFSLLGNAERPVLVFALMAIGTLPASAALGWVLLIDRSTLSGVVKRPDDSIESAWYEKAASGAFGDILLVGGLGAAVFAFMKIEAPVSWCLSAMVLFAMLDIAARYLWQKKSAS
ncbi:hypothetical protein ACFQ4U_02445 [Micrococcus antarcticus]